MTTATTTSIATSPRRTRIERSSDGVIAAYVHSLANLLRPEPERLVPDSAPTSAVWPCDGRAHGASRVKRGRLAAAA